MGHRETRAQREERRARNAKTRAERKESERPVGMRRTAEAQRAQAKAEAVVKAWDLVLQAVAPLAPGGTGFEYAGVAFADPADNKAYNTEFKTAMDATVAGGADPKDPLVIWRTWAGVAMPWIERRKMRPVRLAPGQLPRARVYPDGSIRLVAPTDADMIALLKRQAGIQDPPAPAAPAPAEEEAPAPLPKGVD